MFCEGGFAELRRMQGSTWSIFREVPVVLTGSMPGKARVRRSMMTTLMQLLSFRSYLTNVGRP